jgi:Cd2+/Zn2+-exporting ATPase
MTAPPTTPPPDGPQPGARPAPEAHRDHDQGHDHDAPARGRVHAPAADGTPLCPKCERLLVRAPARFRAGPADGGRDEPAGHAHGEHDGHGHGHEGRAGAAVAADGAAGADPTQGRTAPPPVSSRPAVRQGAPGQAHDHGDDHDHDHEHEHTADSHDHDHAAGEAVGGGSPPGLSRYVTREAVAVAASGIALGLGSSASGWGGQTR